MSKFNLVQQSYQLATFSAYDFATVKRALIENIKREFPETFNDFTEFSELIMIVNSFAYISELFAYRLDINAQENFIQLASIKENVIRLAQWIGYNPKRCIPARGLFKLQSLTPAFNVIDNRGENLRNKTVRWNDPNNVFWKSQFLTILQTAINEELLNPLESNRVQINNTLVEKYSFENLQTKFGTLSFKALDGTPFNVVSSVVDEKGFVENNPRSTNKTSLYFLDDSSSDASPTTGFFIDAVQGDIQSIPISFDNIVPNRTYTINVPNINEFDVWLYETNSNQFWYNTTKLYFIDKPSSKLFKVNTLNDESIELEFGDGVISDIPVGEFTLFVRTSINENLLIDKNSLSNVSINIPLFLNNNKTSLGVVASCETDLYAVGSEDTQHIKRVASSLYQTQDRLVTEYDFKNFLQQDPRILCSNPHNIKSIGDTSYFKWMQQSDSNFNLTFDDLYLFNDVEITVDTYNDISISDVIEQIERLLSKHTVIQTQSSLHTYNPLRTKFNRLPGNEYDTLISKLGSNSTSLTNFPLCLSKSTTVDLWEFSITTRLQNNPVWNFNNVIIVDKISTNTNTIWKIYSKHTNIVVGKENTQFIHNDFLTNQKFTIHPYNLDVNNIPVLNIALFEADTSVLHNGVVVKNALNVVGNDTNNDGIPNIINLHSEINFTMKKYECSTYIEGGSYFIDIPFDNLPVIPYTQDIVKITDTDTNPVNFTYTTINYEPTRKIQVSTIDSMVYVFIKQYVFIKKGSTYSFVNKSYDLFNKIIAVNDNHPEYKRCVGKGNVLGKYNFNIPFYQILNPEHTNLISIDIITRQMIESYKKYLSYGTQYVTETSFDLTNKFTYLIQKSMFTDVVTLLPGKISAFIGSKSDITRQYLINVKKNPNGFMLPIDIKNAIIQIITTAFESDFVMGEVIYAAQIVGIIMYKLSNEILDVNIISINPATFGQEIDTITGDANELLYPHITYNDINIS